MPEGTVPVGVITLASMREKKDSGIPSDSVRAMQELVEELTALGLELLQV